MHYAPPPPPPPSAEVAVGAVVPQTQAQAPVGTPQKPTPKKSYQQMTRAMRRALRLSRVGVRPVIRRAFSWA